MGSVSIGNFNWKEKIFFAITWISTGTVQAAVASIMLDFYSSTGASDEQLKRSFQLLSILVLSILLTAPTSAFLMKYFGPRLLDPLETPIQDELDLQDIENDKELNKNNKKNNSGNP